MFQNCVGARGRVGRRLGSIAGIASCLLIVAAGRAAAQPCGCDRLIPCALDYAGKMMNENGSDRSDGAATSVSAPTTHGNLFDFAPGFLLTHVCFSPIRSGDTVRIHVSGDAGGFPGAPFFSTPAFTTDLSADLLGRLQLVDILPPLGVSGRVWVQVEYLNATASVKHQGIRARTAAPNTGAVRIQGYSWVHYDDPGVYPGFAPVIRALHLVPAIREVVMTPGSLRVTSEAGLTSSFTVVLRAKAPTSDVVIDLVSNDPCEGFPVPARLTFTVADWNVPQTVMAVGADDPFCDGPMPYVFRLALTTSDPCWAGVVAPSVYLENRDDDRVPDFDPAVQYAAGNAPQSAAIGDFDRDGALDLATANAISNDVTVLFNAGAGSFAGRIDVPVGAFPKALVARDLDGDGDADLAVADETSGTVSILRSNGNRTFAAAVPYRVGADPRAITAGDLDGDGDVDLVTANTNPPSSNVSVILNNGNGTFGPDTNYTAGTLPISVALGDFDSDGDLDLAVANASSSDVSILRNGGSGVFSLPASYPLASPASSIVAGDFDRDGDPDLAVTESGGMQPVSILFNGGGGVFGSFVSTPFGDFAQQLAAEDFDRDGDLDLAMACPVANFVRLLVNDGAGAMSVGSAFGTGAFPVSVSAGDLNGDGHLDLVTADSSSNGASVLLGRCVPSIPFVMEAPVPGSVRTVNTFSAQFTTAGDRVAFFAGLRSGSTAIAGCPGLSADMLNARLLGTAVADSCGVAKLQFRVPARASGKHVLFQAVDLSICLKTAPVGYTFP